jgi:glycosyltransferase involved in cell wall biosynthesis
MRQPRFRWLPVLVVSEAFFLIRYCRTHHVQILHAHLDLCSLIAVFSQFFIKTRVVVTRHHAEALEYEATARARAMSKLIYRLAPRIIAVSNNVKTYLVQKEGVDERKIVVIPLSYDFRLYGAPNAQHVAEIRVRYGKKFLMVTVGRFSPLKRIELIVELTGRLASAGVDCALIIVGRGPEESNLKKTVSILGLEDRVLFTGFIDHVLDYLAAADLYVHFSITEATCTTVKEAALASCPVLVCNGVGDFAEYVCHQENGFIVEQENPVSTAVQIIVDVQSDRARLKSMGQKLHATVLKKFDIKTAMPLYEKLHVSDWNAANRI